ncbi:sodium-dependent proline transporter-like [Eupeodes corollae]|uniref:sodium-dependent proline transporter-like n=1 Tax=Eupeodes corollae TaxID=290404 RepID=UPI002492D8F4|nr:sodium-dependent proline transporter-like [Eupeodes corollae]
MEYETSYDTGLKPFNHDKNRGKWASSKDFFFACAGHAFKADAILVMPILVFEDLGIYALIPYLIISAICVVPIVFIQSFLGQFSSSGFISVFRIAPLFKGIGHVSLLVNVLTLTYYSVFSAIPLFHLFHSLRPTIPWSCEGAKEWMEIEEINKSFCINANNTYTLKVPSVQFFINHVNIASSYDEVKENTFSFQLILCTCIVWAIVTFIILKNTEFIGRFVRYSFLAVITLMSICLIRFIFLPGAINGLWEFLFPSTVRIFWDTWLFLPGLTLSILGPGWGSILTMASFNDFKTNIFGYSWAMCLAQLGLMLGIAFLSIFIKYFMITINSSSTSYLEFTHLQWLEFLSIGTALTYLEIPHFWCLLFFGMWTLGSLNILVIQLLSLLTSLFDEFEQLRENKQRIIYGTVGVFVVTSILFCSNHGVYSFGVLSKYSILTQMILNLLLILVVLWIYGRERFQRDLNFMTSRTYSTWMVYIVRFVAPIFLLVALLTGLIILMEFDYAPSSNGIIVLLFVTLMFLLSWCLIPGYCIYKIKHTTGIIGMRFRRSVRPTDWYPADPVYKQRYEESFNTTDISHQLTVETME